MEIDENETKRVLCRFKSDNGDHCTPEMDLPLTCTLEQLSLICNALQNHSEDPLSYTFFINDAEITHSLEKTLAKVGQESETVVEIVYQQEAVFKVRPVTRCTGSMPGHAEAVVSVSFSPDGKSLASGSGDTTVRLWDIYTQTPVHTCKGHRNWVLCIAWAPDGACLASACKNGEIRIWDPNSGAEKCKLAAHKQYVTSMSWEPYHLNSECRHLASASKDCDVIIWDVRTAKRVLSLSGHTKTVSQVKWGGSGLIYTASQDRTVKVWRSKDGILCRTLQGHAHWVNTLALNTDYVLRIGAFDPISQQRTSSEVALQKYRNVAGDGEKLVSGSDDFTLYMWKPESQTKPVCRMTGHQQLINDVKFSPDARVVASASFDKSVRLWDGKTGNFICTLRGHVQAVYMVAFSADSRLMVSGSADSTLKLWNLKEKKLEIDLPGHGDEVFAVDWASDGLRVASGGRDKVLKLWQN